MIVPSPFGSKPSLWMACGSLMLAASMLGCGGGSSSDAPTSTNPTNPPVTQTTPTITWDTPPPITYGSWLGAAALSAVANVPGTFSYAPAVGTQMNTLGPVELSAIFTPKDTASYATATAKVTLQVTQGTPSLKWDTPAPVVQGTALDAKQLNATVQYGVSGFFGYVPRLGEVMNNPGTHVLTAIFIPTDTKAYATTQIATVLTVLPSAGVASIDFDGSAQTIRGFGGSEAWSSGMPATQISKLFGTSPGDLGLSIMRIRIAPATWDATAKTAGTSAWDAELGNAKAAQDMGATIFASPWTPPPSMKINNASRSDKTWSGMLDPGKYGDYAAYLKAYVDHATSKGVNLYAISMQNEPDWDPQDYESCLWSGEQLATWVANYGSIPTAGTSVKLMMPESLGFRAAASDPALNNAQAANNISILGGHLYGTTPSYPVVAKSLDKEVWMTEHYLDSTSKTSSASSWSTTFADALAIAEEVHAAMTLGQYNAYVWWWMVCSNDNQPTGLIDSKGQPTFFGIGLQHFSRFIRPGYVRCDATALPMPNVRLSAFSGGGHYVIVAINSSSSDVTLPIQIFPHSLPSLTPYQTTSSQTMKALAPVSINGGQWTANLPAKSITTFVD